MTIATEAVLAEIKQRISAQFADARVEDGWPQLFLSSNQQWPLITIAPIFDQTKTRPQASITTLVIEIRVLNKASGGVMAALLKQRKTIRNAIFAVDPFLNRQLTEPLTEPEELEFHEPLPNQPFCGFSLLARCKFNENNTN